MGGAEHGNQRRRRGDGGYRGPREGDPAGERRQPEDRCRAQDDRGRKECGEVPRIGVPEVDQRVDQRVQREPDREA